MSRPSSPILRLRRVQPSLSLHEITERIKMRDFLRMELFFRDLISYSLLKHKSSFEVPHLHECGLYQQHKRFIPEIGDAILIHRQLYRRRITNNISTHLDATLSEELVTNCMLRIADEQFKGNHFLDEFISFCAHFVDLSMFLMLHDYNHFMEDVFNSIEILYKDRFARRFSPNNIWNELHRLAIRRIIYGTH